MSPGEPFPLGATFDGLGTNFAVFSQAAEAVRALPVRRRRHRDALPAARSRRLLLARPPRGRRAGLPVRVPGPWAVPAGGRAAVQPGEAPARPVRQSGRRRGAMGPAALRLRPGAPTTCRSTPATRPSRCRRPSWWTRHSTGAPTARRARCGRTPIIYETHVKGLTWTHPGIPDHQRGHLRRPSPTRP